MREVEAFENFADKGFVSFRKMRLFKACKPPAFPAHEACFLSGHRAFDFFKDRPHLKLMVGVLKHKSSVRHQSAFVA